MQNAPNALLICRLMYSLASCILTATWLPAQVTLDQPPIDYYNAEPEDPVARLQSRIDAGEIKLEYDQRFGYLRSVLEHLDVPPSSQALVFSKTSFQFRRISPRTPRAIYFGDDVYVGWVRSGDMVEFSAVDPNLGANFYTLSQEESSRPQFRRHTHECLQCHGSSLTKGVPGHMIRSVYTDGDGQLLLSRGTHLTDHTSPLEERWGGWYVTGQHGRARHLGNSVWTRSEQSKDETRTEGLNVTDLTEHFNTDTYLSGHSDIVGLMVLEHQANMHNLIAYASFHTRMALRDQQVMNEMLDRPNDYRSESTERRIQSAVEPVVRHMLFVGETRLTDPVSGTSSFAEDFSDRGPCVKQGRSLREFDLTRRLFKYPCSYLIHSEAFDRLPSPSKDYVYRRLWEILSREDTSDDYRHLSTADRQAILEIVRDTKDGLPRYWR